MDYIIHQPTSLVEWIVDPLVDPVEWIATLALGR
jgi:hypothetical protein